MDNYHITKDGEHWKFQMEGGSRAIKLSDTKADAIKHMRRYMEGKTGSVKIHLENGQFEEERTYPRSADPSQSPG